jgi:DNA-binding IclR family transcriptional regulator
MVILFEIYENKVKIMDNSTYPPSALRVLEILELISKANKPLSANDIARQLSLPIASVYRLLRLLYNKLYISSDSVSANKYVPGFKILELAHNVNNATDITMVARPVMRSIAEKTGQASMLTIIHDDGIMVIDQVLPSKPVRILSAVREKLPVNVSSSGKVLTAFMPIDEQDSFLKKAWRFVPSNTTNTITSLQQFKQEITLVKERKYATDSEEYAIGIGSLSVPVFNYTGKAICALGITGHIADYNNRNKFNFMLNELIKSGKEISSSMGYKKFS